MSAIRSIFFLALGCHPVISLVAGFRRGLRYADSHRSRTDSHWSRESSRRDVAGSEGWSSKLNLGIKKEISVRDSVPETLGPRRCVPSRHNRWSGLWKRKVGTFKHRPGLRPPGEEGQGGHQHPSDSPSPTLFPGPCPPLPLSLS